MDACHCIMRLSKPIDYTASSVNPNANCGRWVILMRQCRFVNCDSCWRMLIMRDAVKVGVGVGGT